MSNKRTILARPRTKIYDVNYNIGENYYKSAIDRLDRKYSGRVESAGRSPARDIFAEETGGGAADSLSAARRRAEKAITESTAFDSTRGSRISAAYDSLQTDIDEETASALQRIRANKKVSVIDDIDMDTAVSNITARRLKQRADQLLDTVGITTLDSSAQHQRNAAYDSSNDVIVRRRAVVKMTTEQDNSSTSSRGGELNKWCSITQSDDAPSADSSAAVRARKSRARINELEDEMNDMAERQQIRERRAARLKALVAETESENAASSSSTVKSVRISSRRQKETIEN